MAALPVMMEAKSKNNTTDQLVMERTQFKTNLTEVKLYQNVHVITVLDWDEIGRPAFACLLLSLAATADKTEQPF